MATPLRLGATFWCIGGMIRLLVGRRRAAHRDAALGPACEPLAVRQAA